MDHLLSRAKFVRERLSISDREDGLWRLEEKMGKEGVSSQRFNSGTCDAAEDEGMSDE